MYCISGADKFGASFPRDRDLFVRRCGNSSPKKFGPKSPAPTMRLILRVQRALAID
jgi:hypothetical protein